MRCGCRKHGLECTNLCTNCDGTQCSNFEKISVDFDSEENFENTENEMNEPDDFPDVSFDYFEPTDITEPEIEGSDLPPKRLRRN